MSRLLVLIGVSAWALVYHTMQIPIVPLAIKALLCTLFMAWCRLMLKEKLEELELYVSSFSAMYIMFMFTQTYTMAFFWMNSMLLPFAEMNWEREIFWSCVFTGIFKLLTLNEK